MSSADPTRRTIVIEVCCYIALVLAFGGAFVAWRVAREGPRVLTHNPHALQRPAPPVADPAGDRPR